MELLFFNPIYQERVWGGRGLKESLGRELPSGSVIGESWDISDRADANSVVAFGEFAGMTLRELLRTQSETIMGSDWDPKQPFPILVKWLDCQQRLSLQVHPPLEMALELGGDPKTENWLVVDAQPGAALLAGLKPEVNRDRFEKALRENRLEDLVCRLPVVPGDSLFVPSGRIHAIDAGNLILEIQQNSDTTYRVYDWGRVGLDGKPRQLHLEESLKCIDFDDVQPELMHYAPGKQVLADCEHFTISRVTLEKDQQVEIGRTPQPRILSVVKGALLERSSNQVILRGDNVLAPCGAHYLLRADQRTELLVTENFA